MQKSELELERSEIIGTVNYYNNTLVYFTICVISYFLRLFLMNGRGNTEAESKLQGANRLQAIAKRRKSCNSRKFKSHLLDCL